jgi:putative SOS response-associated peptidase YedK
VQKGHQFTMCGRTTLHHTPEEIAERFAVNEILYNAPPRYNVAPLQPMNVVTQNAFGDGLRLLEGMRWGLVPSWAKDASIGSRLINARCETLLEKPAFRAALRRRRCLIPADGFYEWQGEGKSKHPMHIRREDGELFALAGLYEEWQAPDGSPLRTCTIVTGRPNELVGPIHDRMPVILAREAEDQWLDTELPAKEALGLLTVFPAEKLVAYEVSREVGDVANDSPSFIEPLKSKATLFDS